MLRRSNIEFAKRVFLDRLTVDAQPMTQQNRDHGPGDEYTYGGVFNASDFGVGADCSGLCGIMIDCAVNGTAATWTRLFTTETFPGPFGTFRRTTRSDLLSGNYPIKVCIYHGGGGPNSHMNVWIDGWLMESNGSSGTCTLGYGATPQDSSYWNDWWVCDGPIEEDTQLTQPMGYPLGLDYAGGTIAGSTLQAQNVSFVCRYLTSGGASLPGKQLQAAEFQDLMSNGISVVFNYETTADFMLHDSGAQDAQDALAYIQSLPGAPAQPVVYFSADWDETPAQQATVNAYLQGAANVLGGPEYVGIYGAYYVGKRALDAGVCKYLWQTEAWSGFGAPYNAPHVDSRVHIVQRNQLGYDIVGGVQCDINEAHANDYGQCRPPSLQPVTPLPKPPQPQPTPIHEVHPISPPKPKCLECQISDIWDMLLTQLPENNSRTMEDVIATIGAQLKIPGFAPPPPGPAVVKPECLEDRVSQIWDQLMFGWPQTNLLDIVHAVGAIAVADGIPGFSLLPPAKMKMCSHLRGTRNE